MTRPVWLAVGVALGAMLVGATPLQEASCDPCFDPSSGLVFVLPFLWIVASLGATARAVRDRRATPR